MPLGFGGSTFRLACQRRHDAPPSRTSQGLRIATSYAGLLDKYLSEEGVDARVIKLDGAVETAIRLGVADAVADVVETGTTLRNVGPRGVRRADHALRGRADQAARRAPRRSGLEQLVRRLQGVVHARDFVMMDYDIRAERIEEAIALTPGMEGPTVSPLHREGWVAVRAMVRRKGHQQVMDQLWDIGGRAILVTDIYACRL